MQCGWVHCGQVHCGWVHCGKVHCGQVHCGWVHCGQVHCGWVHCGQVQCSQVHCGQVHCGWVHCGQVHCGKGRGSERNPRLCVRVHHMPACASLVGDSAIYHGCWVVRARYRPTCMDCLVCTCKKQAITSCDANAGSYTHCSRLPPHSRLNFQG